MTVGMGTVMSHKYISSSRVVELATILEYNSASATYGVMIINGEKKNANSDNKDHKDDSSNK